MSDLELIGLLALSLVCHFKSILIPIGLTAAALASAAVVDFELVAA